LQAANPQLRSAIVGHPGNFAKFEDKDPLKQRALEWGHPTRPG